MVSVTADQVRKRLGLKAEDVSDVDVLAFVDEAAAFLSEEIGRSLDYTNCTKSEAGAISNLAAIYCYCHVTGGSAVGLSYSVGQLTVSESSQPVERAAQLAFLKEQVERFIQRQRTFNIVLSPEESLV